MSQKKWYKKRENIHKKISILLSCLFLCLFTVGSSTADNWPMFHHDSAHSGVSTTTIPSTNEVRWTYQLGGAIYSSPAVVDNKVYIGSNDFSVYCLDIYDGSLKWSYATNGVIKSSPAVVNEKVYIGSGDGYLYCLDAETGMKEWSFGTGGSIHSSPVVVNDKVYVGSDDGNLYCLPATGGNVFWIYETSGAIKSSPALYNTNVYFGSLDKTVYCVDTDTGVTVWNYVTNGAVRSSPTIVDNKVYIGSDDGNVYCLDAAGDNEENTELIWLYSTGDNVESTPAISDDLVFIGSNDDSLYCLYTAGGTKKWSVATANNIAAMPAVTAEAVVITSNDGSIYALSRDDGTELWSYGETALFSSSSPALYEGRVYVGSYAGLVYCFGNAPPSTPLKPSGVASGYVDSSYTFSTSSVDPDGDTVTYQFDWGDGTKSDWSTATSASHSWTTAGSYEIQVKAQDEFGGESEWSEQTTLVITERSYQLHIISASTVLEAATLDIIITLNDALVEGATVELFDEVQETSSEGKVSFVAPEVEKNTNYEIQVSYEEYDPATKTITVLNTAAEKETGWIYGIITDASATVLKDAHVCAVTWVDNERQERTCDFTNEEGDFLLQLDPGEYTVTVQKEGYESCSVTNVLVQDKMAIEVNVEMNAEQTPTTSSNQLIEYTITEKAKSDIVGARIDIHPQENVISYYDELSISSFSSEANKVEFVISSETVPGSIIAVYLGKGTLESLDNIDIQYDGETLEESTTVEQFFDLSDLTPSYLRILTNDGLYVFIKTHFSEHTITISSLAEVVSIIAISLYIVVLAILAIGTGIPVIRLWRKIE